MKDLRDFRVGEDLTERRHFDLCQRIDDVVFARNRDLDQADLVEVRVQRVGFRVDGDRRLRGDGIEHRVERLLSVDPLHIVCDARPIAVTFSL